MDIFNTDALLMAVQKLTPVSSFLRDRYFPLDPNTGIYNADSVIVDYKEGKKRVAPFVSPRKGGVTVLRDGYVTSEYKPPYVALSRPLTVDDLETRGFGEALYSGLTPEDRESVITLGDASDLDEYISRREEVMAAEVMLTNGCVMKAITNDKTIVEENEIRFYKGETNPAQYTPTTGWDESGAKIKNDLEIMVRMLTSNGLPAADLVCSPDVASAIIDNAEIQKLLNILNYNVGSVEPIKLTDSAAIMAKLNILGRVINIITYDEGYLDDADGQEKLFIPSGHCVLSAPNAGHRQYARISQLEDDKHTHTYPGTRVPLVTCNTEDQTRKFKLSSRPLLSPLAKNPFISAKVL